MNYLYSVPYLFIFNLLFFLNFPILSGKQETLTNTIQKILVISLLLFFIGLRGFIFTDWISYYPFYSDAPSWFDGNNSIKLFFTEGNQSTWEHGFLLYTIICKTISSNYFFFQIVSHIIDIIILYYIFKIYIPQNIILGFVFFFIFKGLNIEINAMRNSKSIMLFLLSIKCIGEKKIVKYLILNSIGCLFHISSIIYFPLYFLLNRKYPIKILLLLLLLGNFVYLFAIDWIKNILIFLGSIISTRLELLLKYYTASEIFSSSYGIGLGYLERQFSFFIILIFYGKLIKKSKDNVIFLNCIVIYWFIFLFCSEMLIIPQRITMLFVFSYWIIFPQLYTIISKKNKYIFLCILLIYGNLLLLQNNTIIHKYENILFGNSNYNQRLPITIRAINEMNESIRD